MATSVVTVNGDDQGEALYVSGKKIIQAHGTECLDVCDVLYALEKHGLIDYESRQIEHDELFEVLDKNNGEYPKSLSELPQE